MVNKSRQNDASTLMAFTFGPPFCLANAFFVNLNAVKVLKEHNQRDYQ